MGPNYCRKKLFSQLDSYIACCHVEYSTSSRPLIQKRINGDLFQMGLDGWSQMDTDTSGEASIEKL